MLKQLPIGIDEFKNVRMGNYYYVDKSLFIKELMDNGPYKVTLIPRPRRFGKTLNMTMLKCFFEKTPKSNVQLFDGLAISKLPEYMAHQGKYPVIYLTLKDIKPDNWKDCYDKLSQVIAAEFERHNYILTKDILTEQQKKDFRDIIERKATHATFENALMNLSLYLQKYHGDNIVILIDEYDSPIHAGFLNNYYKEIISFMRGFLCGGLKGNSYLAYGVLTGILRVAKESIFSGINNLDVHSLLSPFYANHFGLLENEVEALLQEYKIVYDLPKARSFYNGYSVGGIPRDEKSQEPYTAKIYNPWSILHFVQYRGSFGLYWVNTSDNKLIQDLIQKAPDVVKIDFENILAGHPINKTICEDTVFTALETDPNALWSFLLFSGYLTWKTRERMQIKCNAELIAPNHEILDCFATLISRWFTESTVNEAYQNMLKALVIGNASVFKRRFKQCVLESFSYFDIGGNAPERVYHAYVLGMLVALSKTHAVMSNHESGLGRYDVCIIPHDKKQIGTIIEFKVFEPEDDKTMEDAATNALAQIEEKKYEVELRKHGITKIIKYGIVFKGKEVLIAQH